MSTRGSPIHHKLTQKEFHPKTVIPRISERFSIERSGARLVLGEHRSSPFSGCAAAHPGAQQTALADSRHSRAQFHDDDPHTTVAHLPSMEWK